MISEEHVLYVALVYGVTFVLLAGYGLWIWRGFAAERRFKEDE